MTPSTRNVVLEGNLNPYIIPGIAARYSLSGASSPQTYLVDGSNRIMLIADQSGNSQVNGLVLPPASSTNYASTPDSAAVSVTGDITVRAWLALATWTPAAISMIVGKAGASNLSYRLGVNTNGTLLFSKSLLGVVWDSVSSSVAPTVSAMAPLWIKAAYASSTGTVQFFTSPDGSTWTQLGTNQTTAAASAIFDGTTALVIGEENVGGTSPSMGSIFYVDVRNTVLDNGTGIVFQADFAAQAKLASSFLESSTNAATVTITTAGDQGVRISGMLDMVQLTQANQPILSVSGGLNIATFNGSSMYMRAPSFALVQPQSVYFAGSAVSWSSLAAFYDGYNRDSMEMRQNSTTGDLDITGSSGLITAGLVTVGKTFVTSVIYNGASSSITINRRALVGGTLTSSTASLGVTIGARGFASGSPDRFANMTFSELIVRSEADPQPLQSQIAVFLIKKWLASLP